MYIYTRVIRLHMLWVISPLYKSNKDFLYRVKFTISLHTIFITSSIFLFLSLDSWPIYLSPPEIEWMLILQKVYSKSSVTITVFYSLCVAIFSSWKVVRSYPYKLWGNPNRGPYRQYQMIFHWDWNFVSWKRIFFDWYCVYNSNDQL